MRDLSGRVKNCVLMWLGHVERMDGEWMTKKIYDSGVKGGLGRARPCKGWMEWYQL